MNFPLAYLISMIHMFALPKILFLLDSIIFVEFYKKVTKMTFVLILILFEFIVFCTYTKDLKEIVVNFSINNSINIFALHLAMLY